ncbi:HNH endonuclease domain-containing protein [Beijerinckia sp. L45]|uniref:HNH endonuclease domain-containing protein n=1 Tax=Beijerinckia sp. L45 TaxID=1641855 RepID=UPI00131AB4FE|nr:HNH endonuclease domain-containing protein [Beijerinckia sp. L45]
MLSLRQGPSEAGRAMFPAPLGEIEAYARDHGLAVVRVAASPDAGGRADVSWTSVCLRVPDDGSAGLPMIRGVILNDDKSSTYKLGLLRAVAKVADVSSSLSRPAPDTDDRVSVPLGLVALNWIRAYLPLVAAGLPQAPGNAGPAGLGFAKAGFRALIEFDVRAQDLRIGATFVGERAIAVHAALVEARRTIVDMPVRYTRMPNAAMQLFEAVATRAQRPDAALSITPAMLWSWGGLSMPGPLWRTMQRHGVWIEPVLVAEWVRLTRGYAVRMGLDLAPGVVEARIAWSEPSRDTALARMVANRIAADGKPIACVWSGVDLQPGTLDVDHALPWSAWPCNDLWNLLPASRRVNQHEKRDRLPTAAALARSRDAITQWWAEAWHSDPALAGRFAAEANASLPIEGEADPQAVFAGMEWRRLRVQQDQAPPSWAGVER